MSLAEIKHNRGVAAQLRKILASGRTVHAFMFCGGTKETRREMGFEFAKAALCAESPDDSCGICPSCRSFASGNHEDFITVEKPADRAGILTEQIAGLQKKLMYKSFGERRVVLIQDAELLNPAAQNKLLKTLEEPAGDTVMILLSERRDALFPTVRSRCGIYELEEPESGNNAAFGDASEKLLDLFACGAPYYLCKAALSSILNMKDGQRGAALDFLELFEEGAVSRLKEGKDPDVYVKAAETAATARRYVKQGQNVSYSLKQLCLTAGARR